MGIHCMRGVSARRFVIPVLLGFSAGAAFAEVTITDRAIVARHQRAQAQEKGEKRQHNRPAASQGGMTARALATGSIQLIDAAGLKYFINDNITFSTSSSASGAMSEASYTHAVAATTSGGGTVASTLNDAFDGYNTVCVSFTGALGPCETGNANYVFYNKNGAATTECGGRQVVFTAQTSGQLQMSRKVYVPSDDTFARWMNIFTNTGVTPLTFTMVTGNNLGSDANTRIVSSSNGNNTAELTDTWVSTFQNYSGTTSSDPRLGHVLQGVTPATPLAAIHFADGDDNPYWGYQITLAPGQTKIIMNFVTAQPSKAAANAKAAALVALPPHAVECMTLGEMAQVVNFAPPQPGEAIPALGLAGLMALILSLAAAGILLIVRLRAGH
jgi:hypothetical protein